MYQNALRRAEADVSAMLCNQITDTDAPQYGGIRSVETWDVNFHDTAALYVWAVRLYLLKDSSFYGDEALYERLQMAYGYCNHWKHEDGTKDYIDCDFHTAAGSEVQNLAKNIHIIDSFGSGSRKEELRKQMVTLMQALTEGLVSGGFHTPNHRWIFSGALAAANSVTPDKRYLDKIESYLLEGIDCDEDGEYAERSAGIYSFVTNEGLILMARYLKRPEFYEYVRRNLYMLRYYMEPDGSIFTMNSTRQDQGTKVWAEKYLSQYLYIARIFGDDVLWKEADRLYLDAYTKGRELPVTLEFLLLNPELKEFHPKNYHVGNFHSMACRTMEYKQEECPQRSSITDVSERDTKEPELLEAYFKNAGIMRRVQGDSSLTLIPGSKTFLFARFGDIDLFMRMSAHFFSVRNIIPERLEILENGYRLTFYAEGNYLLPLKEKPDTPDWWQMDHSKRDILKRTSLHVEVDVFPSAEGIGLFLRTKTCDHVPFRVEIGISSNCLVRGDGFLCKAQPGMWIVPTSGSVTAETTRYGIEIGEVFGEHGKVTGREGSAPQSSTHMTLYLNQVCTDQERVFHIKKVKQTGNMYVR